MNHVTASVGFPALPVVGNESFRVNLPLRAPWRSAVEIKLWHKIIMR